MDKFLGNFVMVWLMKSKKKQQLVLVGTGMYQLFSHSFLSRPPIAAVSKVQTPIRKFEEHTTTVLTAILSCTNLMTPLPPPATPMVRHTEPKDERVKCCNVLTKAINLQKTVFFLLMIVTLEKIDLN